MVVLIDDPLVVDYGSHTLRAGRVGQFPNEDETYP